MRSKDPTKWGWSIMGSFSSAFQFMSNLRSWVKCNFISGPPTVGWPWVDCKLNVELKKINRFSLNLTVGPVAQIDVVVFGPQPWQGLYNFYRNRGNDLLSTLIDWSDSRLSVVKVLVWSDKKRKLRHKCTYPTTSKSAQAWTTHKRYIVSKATMILNVIVITINPWASINQ